jgi:hypothetical protein
MASIRYNFRKHGFNILAWEFPLRSHEMAGLIVLAIAGIIACLALSLIVIIVR